jgi:hypothetical protein
LGTRRIASAARHVAAAFSCSAIVFACEQKAPPAYPSAVITVDTDMPVPQVISRLRVDIFNGSGDWIDERQFAFTDAAQWPVSFGVFLPDDTRSVDIMLRIRGFAAERDYLGERFVARRPFEPERVATSLQDLCATAPVLPHAAVVVQRTGGAPFFKVTCGADLNNGPLPNETGSVAGYVDIPKAGRYRFEVVTSLFESRRTFAFGSSLHLVKDCKAPETFIECSHDIDTDNNRFGHIERDLEPGRYALVTGSSIQGSVGYVALRWAASDQWHTSELPPPPTTPDPPSVALKMIPAKDAPALDPTPTTEPSPENTIDRLVRLRLDPGNPVTPRIVLRGACVGTMAKLAIDGTRVQNDKSETCIDDAMKLVPTPIGSTPADDAVVMQPGSPRGTFASEPCAEEDSNEAVACVPGGAFLMGDALAVELPGAPPERPVRTVAVNRFFIDRYEFTVARYRAAVAKGLVLQGIEPGTNDPKNAAFAHATFTPSPSGKEDFPLNQVVWAAARRICQFVGGDLPSEAQWERAATFVPNG